MMSEQSIEVLLAKFEVSRKTILYCITMNSSTHNLGHSVYYITPMRTNLLMRTNLGTVCKSYVVTLLHP